LEKTKVNSVIKHKTPLSDLGEMLNLRRVTYYLVHNRYNHRASVR